MNLDTVLPRAKSRGRQMVGGTMRHAKVEAGVVALIAVGCILFARAGSLQLTIAAFTLVWLLMGQSWNIISGMAGPLALGQAAFFGTSDFLSIWLHTNAGLNTWLAILLALLASAAMAAVLGALALRLPFFYFAIASLMVPLILESLAEYGGFYQLLRPSYPSATFAQFWWPTAYAYVIIGAIAVTLVAVFTARLGGVRTGRFFLAIRESLQGRGDLALRFRDIAAGLRRNAVLLAHARDCLHDVLSAFHDANPTTPYAPPAASSVLSVRG